MLLIKAKGFARSRRPKPLAILYWSFVATTTLAALLVVGTFWLAARTEREDQWVLHTLAVRHQIAQMLILVQRAQSSARGYLLTDHKAYLKPYEGAVVELPNAFARMAKLVAGNARQTQATMRLRALAADRLGELRRAIQEHKTGQIGTPEAVTDAKKDLQTMDHFRRLVAAMTAEEDRLLRLRHSRSATFGLLLKIGTGISFLLICLVGALVGFLTRRSFTELAAARDRLIVANRELRQQVDLRESAESQLRQAQKMEAIGQLSGGLAHDFNNMLGVVSASLDLIRRQIKSGKTNIDSVLDAATRATERAGALTHRLLAFARQQPLSPEAIDANRLIGAMSELLRSTLGAHIAVETVSAAGLWRTKADAQQLENAILNIVINARDSMPDGGRLTIETGNAYLDDAYCKLNCEVGPGQFVMIAITDTGAGMEADVLARAFDPFFTTKPVGTGTGLGLSQVYGFVKQSQGHIKIYSEPSAGTTVKIYLPRLLGEAEKAKERSKAPLQMGKAGEAVLVVEDDPLLRRLTTDSLRELGYTVYDSETATDALALLACQSGITLLLTDIVMPGINGKKLADEARRSYPHLKVLFTTGYTPNAVINGGMLDAGMPFLPKPFSLEQLAAKVRTVLDA